MKPSLKLIQAMMVGLFAMTTWACDSTIHEYPDEWQISQDFTLRFILDLHNDLPPYAEITAPRAFRSMANPQQKCMPHRVRFTVNIYRADAEGHFGRKAEQQLTFFAPPNEVQQQEIHLQLLPGTYRFMTWVDYVLEGSDKAVYYDASNFQEVKMLRNADDHYQGNTPWKDAFTGQADQIVHPMQNAEVTVKMERPLAKFRFVTTDLDEFIEQALEYERSQAANGCKTGNTKNDTNDNLTNNSRSIDLSRYHVMIIYPMFAPFSYNMFTNKPADSWASQRFEGQIEQLSSTEAELGFDFTFVNHEEAKATVALAIYDADWNLLSATDPITLPLLRSHLTTVRGKFLTSKATGAVGINPSFDGEYNIEIR